MGNDIDCGLVGLEVYGVFQALMKIGRKDYSLADLKEPPIFNGLYTILNFKDGSKSVVKCSDNDYYDKPFGVMMALLKAQCGEDHKAYAQSIKVMCEVYGDKNVWYPIGACESFEAAEPSLTDACLYTGCCNDNDYRLIGILKDLLGEERANDVLADFLVEHVKRISGDDLGGGCDEYGCYNFTVEGKKDYHTWEVGPSFKGDYYYDNSGEIKKSVRPATQVTEEA